MTPKPSRETLAETLGIPEDLRAQFQTLTSSEIKELREAIEGRGNADVGEILTEILTSRTRTALRVEQLRTNVERGRSPESPETPPETSE